MVPMAALAQDAANGGTVYEGTCVACHGADGTGAIGGLPDLADRLGKTDAELFDSVRNGFDGPGGIMPMPANGGNPNLTEQDVHDVIAYIRQTYGE